MPTRQEDLRPDVLVHSHPAGRTPEADLAGLSVNAIRALATVSLDRFGASAPAEVLFREFGFTPEHVADRAGKLVGGGSRA